MPKIIDNKKWKMRIMSLHPPKRCYFANGCVLVMSLFCQRYKFDELSTVKKKVLWSLVFISFPELLKTE